MILAGALIVEAPIRLDGALAAPGPEARTMFVDLLLGDDERRRQHGQVAVAPSAVPDVGPHDEARLERRGRERSANRAGAREWRSASPCPPRTRCRPAVRVPARRPRREARAAPASRLVQHRAHRGAALDQPCWRRYSKRGHAGRAQGRVMRECLRMQQARPSPGPAPPPAAAVPPRRRAARSRRRFPCRVS